MRKTLILLAVLLSAFAVFASGGKEKSKPAPAAPPAPAPAVQPVAAPRPAAAPIKPPAAPTPRMIKSKLLLEPVSYRVEFPGEEDGWKLKLGRQYLVGDEIAITPVSFETTVKLGCYAQGGKTLEGAEYKGPEEGKVFLVLRADIQNLSSYAIDFTKSLKADLVGAKEPLGFRIFQADHSNGTDNNPQLYEPKDVGRQNERFAINEADNFPIKPQETGHFIICLIVPEELAGDGEPHDMAIRGMGLEAVFDAGSQAPSPAEAESRGQKPFEDDAAEAPEVLSRIQYLREAVQTLGSKQGGLDSIQFARNTYLQSLADQRMAKQIDRLDKKISLTTNGAALKASFSRLDRTAKMLRFNAFIDLGFARTKTFEIGVPFSYLIHLAPESAGCDSFLNSLPDKFAAGWKPLVFGLVGYIGLNDDGSYSPLAEEIEVWDSNSGSRLGKVENLRLADFRVAGYNPDDIEELPSCLDHTSSLDNKYWNKNPYGLTKSFKELSEEAAKQSEERYVLEFDTMEKEARAKAEEMARKALVQEKPEPSAKGAKQKAPAKPKPLVVFEEVEKSHFRSCETTWSLGVDLMPFAFDLGTIERPAPGEGFPLRFVVNVPAWPVLVPMASVGWGQPANPIYVGWQACSSAKLFSAFSLHWSLSGGLELGNVVYNKNEDDETPPPKLTLTTRTRCECALVAAISKIENAHCGFAAGASLVVDLTPAETAVGFGFEVSLMDMWGGC